MLHCLLTLGVSIFTTRVGDPFSPKNAGSVSRSEALQVVISVAIARFLPSKGRKTRLGNLLDDGKKNWKRRPGHVGILPRSNARLSGSLNQSPLLMQHRRATGRSNHEATAGPTWAVSPSVARSPVMTRSGRPTFSMAFAST